MKRIHLSLMTFLLLVVPTVGQVDATFATFGSGCPGSGTGLDANITVLPASMSSRFGSGNAIPFGWMPHRYQQVLSGTDMPSAFTMAGLSLRQPNRGPLSNRFTIDMEIQVGYTSRTPATMSTVYAQNYDSGTPVVVLPRSQIVIPDMVPTGPSSPADFFFTIRWPTTFDWVPAPNRHLLVQVTVFGNSYGSGTSGYAFDMGSDPTMARLYSTSLSATSGTLERNFGIVMGIRALSHTVTPELFSTNTPMVNDQFRVRVRQARASASAYMVLGISASRWNGSPLPQNLGWLGAPACSLLTSLDDVQSLSIDASGSGSHEYNIPNSIYLLGARIYSQAIIVDPVANPLGLALTNGGIGVIGNQ